MKKIVISLLCIISMALSGCTCTVSRGASHTEQSPNVVYIDGKPKYDNYGIVTMTYNGESHEYIWCHNSYGSVLTHWEGCKYCKSDKERISNR